MKVSPTDQRLIFSTEYQVPDSALPIGATRTTTTTQLVEVDPTSTRATLELVNQVLAIMQAPDDADDETTVGSPILGFVHMCVFPSGLGRPLKSVQFRAGRD